MPKNKKQKDQEKEEDKKHVVGDKVKSVDAQIQATSAPSKPAESPKIESVTDPNIAINPNAFPSKKEDKKEEKVLSPDEIKNLPSNEEEGKDDIVEDNNIYKYNDTYGTNFFFPKFHFLPSSFCKKVTDSYAKKYLQKMMAFNDGLYVIKEKDNRQFEELYNWNHDQMDYDVSIFNNLTHNMLLTRANTLLDDFNKNEKIHIINEDGVIDTHCILTKIDMGTFEIHLFQFPQEYFENKRSVFNGYTKKIFSQKSIMPYLKFDVKNVVRVYYYYSNSSVELMNELYHTQTKNNNIVALNEIIQKPLAYLKNMAIDNKLIFVLKEDDIKRKYHLRKKGINRYVLESYIVSK